MPTSSYGQPRRRINSAALLRIALNIEAQLRSAQPGQLSDAAIRAATDAMEKAIDKAADLERVGN
jgi:hypothetical protein